MSLSVTIAFFVGLIIGIGVDKGAREQRDKRIKDLEEHILVLSEINKQQTNSQDHA